jgi:hypothetical protein
LNRHAIRAAALLGLALGLSACSGVRHPPTGASHPVELDGQVYRVEQITASTWTAIPPPGLSRGDIRAASLVQVIEKASGCKVTDSSFGPQEQTLSAQVDCGSILKN